MPDPDDCRRRRGAERQAAYMARLKGAHFQRVDDATLLQEATRRGLLDHQPDQGANEGDAR